MEVYVGMLQVLIKLMGIKGQGTEPTQKQEKKRAVVLSSLVTCTVTKVLHRNNNDTPEMHPADANRATLVRPDIDVHPLPRHRVHHHRRRIIDDRLR